MTRRLAIVVCVVLAVGACRSHWTAEVKQPPLFFDASKVARTSMTAAIFLRDMEIPLPREWSLANTAYYVAVSRDRFRFHLTLTNKWESMCDLDQWTAYVEDARGTRYEPEHIDRHVRAMSLGRLLYYHGTADFEIYRRDLLDNAERMTLVLRRPGYEYRYVWKSLEDDDDAS